MKSVLTKCLLGLSLAACSLSAQSVIWSTTYSPNSAWQVDNSPARWATYSLPNSTYLGANVWNPYDAYGSRVDGSGWHMPMQMWTKLYDATKRHWNVSYDVLGEMGAGNPYRSGSGRYLFIKAYPSHWIQTGGFAGQRWSDDGFQKRMVSRRAFHQLGIQHV